jgi:SpoVK/Ycf46/Vps4 family AAA+-type ATPase
LATNKTRRDPYKNFKFRVLLGAAIVGLAAYVSNKAIGMSRRAGLGPADRFKLLRVDSSQLNESWDDLGLSHTDLSQLRELADVSRRAARTEGRNARRKTASENASVTALFAGAPGTGKILASQLIAAGLGVELYRIDMARVVSKYVGDTSKNLERVFDAVEGSGAVLLLEEADALFGKRSEVRDSHDRYANIEVSYLLQRMEDHGGPVILATNFKQNIDAAFLRRLRFIVDFPSPGTGGR